MSVTVLHAPLHAPTVQPRRTVGLACGKRCGAHSVGFTEAYPPGMVKALARKKGWEAFCGSGGRDQRRGARDTTILLRAGSDVIGQWAWRVSEKTKPGRIAPDRFVTVVAYQAPGVGPFAHVAVHLNYVGPDVVRPVLKHVVEYVESADTLDRVLTFLDDDGFEYAVTGDVNLAERDEPGKRFRTPYDVFRRHSLTWRSAHLDVAAWSNGLRLAGFEIVPTHVTRSNHPWLRTTLKRKAA